MQHPARWFHAAARLCLRPLHRPTPPGFCPSCCRRCCADQRPPELLSRGPGRREGEGDLRDSVGGRPRWALLLALPPALLLLPPPQQLRRRYRRAARTVCSRCEAGQPPVSAAVPHSLPLSAFASSSPPLRARSSGCRCAPARHEHVHAPAVLCRPCRSVCQGGGHHRRRPRPQGVLGGLGREGGGAQRVGGGGGGEGCWVGVWGGLLRPAALLQPAAAAVLSRCSPHARAAPADASQPEAWRRQAGWGVADLSTVWC